MDFHNDSDCLNCCECLASKAEEGRREGMLRPPGADIPVPPRSAGRQPPLYKRRLSALPYNPSFRAPWHKPQAAFLICFYGHSIWQPCIPQNETVPIYTAGLPEQTPPYPPGIRGSCSSVTPNSTGWTRPNNSTCASANRLCRFSLMIRFT